MATFNWANYISLEAPKANVNLIADSGYIMDFTSPLLNNRYVYRETIQKLTHDLNITLSQNMKTYCNYSGKEVWKCLTTQYIIENINPKIRILIVESLFDSWVGKHVLGTDCFFKTKQVLDNCTDLEIAQFERHSSLLIKQLTEKANIRKNITAFLVKGNFHAPMYIGWIWNNEDYYVDGYSLDQVIDLWYNRDKRIDGKILYQKTIKRRMKDLLWYGHYYKSFLISIIRKLNLLI